MRQETVRDTAAVAEYFHFMKPESPFLNAIVLSPFSRRWRAEHSPLAGDIIMLILRSAPPLSALCMTAW